MDKRLFEYTTKLISAHFKEANLKPGDKYNIRYENREQVAIQYEALKQNPEFSAQTFSFNDYETFYYDVADVKLIIASNHDVSDDFLTGIRNRVGENEPDFLNTAVLFIHDTSLDSIISGSESFLKKGMPLHTDEVIKQIRTQVNESSKLQRFEQKILSFMLNSDTNDLFECNRSLFDFSVFLSALSQGSIDESIYKQLGLFKDPALVNGSITSESEINKRLEQNHKWYGDIQNAHQFGSAEKYLEKNFSEPGVKKLKKEEEWDSHFFTELSQWSEERKNAKGLEYQDNSLGQDEFGVSYWDRADGTTAAKKRSRNIIIFNSGKFEQLKPVIRFDGLVQKDGIKPTKPLSTSDFITSGKSIELTLKIENPNDVSYRVFSFTDKAHCTFKFKILVVPFAEDLLNGIDTIYTVNTGKKRIELETEDDLVFNSGVDIKLSRTLQANTTYELKPEQQLTLEQGNSESYDNDAVDFSLSSGDSDLGIRLKFASVKTVSITGSKVWKLKRETGKSFLHKIYKDKNDKEVVCLEHNNQKYFPTGDFRSTIKLEQQIVEQGGYHWFESRSLKLTVQDLPIRNNVKSVYDKIIDYFRRENLLPSTAVLNDELVSLYQDYVKVFTEATSLSNDQSPAYDDRNLARVGTIKVKHGENLIKWSPLHPINVAFQLQLNQELCDDKVEEMVLQKLSPVNLVPYLYDTENDLYQTYGQNHSPEWQYFTNLQIDSHSLSKNFVPGLVTDKITEFLRHFSHLFPVKGRSPLRINCINLGDCGEVLQGIYNFYHKKLHDKKTTTVNELPPINVQIYAEEDVITKFEEVSLYSDPELVEKHFGLQLSKSNVYEPVDLLDIFHNKVHFYRSRITELSEFEYSHISFYQFSNKELKIADNIIDQVPSGISLAGLTADIPSLSTGESYRTGFGVKGLADNNQLLTLTKQYNSLAYISASEGVYNSSKAICTVINKSSKDSLDKVYSKSQWVTFIDPRVELSFFKENKDVVIIHYSDQYTSSSGYDAVTVTKKWEQYQTLLSEHLRQQGITHESEETIKLINMFNAINGDWLLKSNSHSKKSQRSREKISILSAVKASFALFDHPNITWIPISLEEVVRVSGSVGLSQKDGTFTSKNLGLKGGMCDDLLMFGLENVGGQLQIHLYPIEVKIGKNAQTTIKKGSLQAETTAKVLNEHLGGKKFEAKLYRNFFAKLALINAERMALYEVWPEYSQKWRDVKSFKPQLLNDSFIISDSLKPHIGSYAVMSFKGQSSFSTRKIEKDGELYMIELREEDGNNYLLKDIEKLRLAYNTKGETDIDTTKLLSHLYEPTESNIITVNFTAGTTALSLKVAESGDGNSGSNEEDEKIEETKESKPLSVLFGHEKESGKAVTWFPTDTNKVMHTNTGIIGTMGTGKTQFTKSLITQLVQNSKDNVNGTNLGILIFDYKGDYIKEDFIAATDAERYDLHCLPYNPLALTIGDKPQPMLPLHTANAIKESIATAFNLGVVQKQKLRDCIMTAYENHGIQKGNPSTWTQPAPTLARVCEVYLNDEDVKQDSLYAAIDNLYQFEVFEPDSKKTKTLFDLLDGVTVINLSGYDEDIQNLVVAITLDQFYMQMQKNGHSTIDGHYRELTKMVLVDEADNFLSQNFASLRKILKEGREFGVGTILSTQFLNHFSTGDNEYSNYILSWIIHRVNEVKNKEVDSLFSVTNRQAREELVDCIKSLDKHYSIVNLAGSEPILMRDRAFWELNNK